MRRLLVPILLIAVGSSTLSAQNGKSRIEGRYLTAETIGWFETGLILPGNDLDDSDWSEILSRFGWVLLERPLSEDARLRTNARANSTKASRSGLMIDTGPFKRVVCVIISRLNDNVLAGHTLAALEAKVAQLEARLAKQ